MCAHYSDDLSPHLTSHFWVRHAARSNWGRKEKRMETRAWLFSLSRSHSWSQFSFLSFHSSLRRETEAGGSKSKTEPRIQRYSSSSSFSLSLFSSYSHAVCSVSRTYTNFLSVPFLSLAFPTHLFQLSPENSPDLARCECCGQSVTWASSVFLACRPPIEIWGTVEQNKGSFYLRQEEGAGWRRRKKTSSKASSFHFLSLGLLPEGEWGRLIRSSWRCSRHWFSYKYACLLPDWPSLKHLLAWQAIIQFALDVLATK